MLNCVCALLRRMSLYLPGWHSIIVLFHSNCKLVYNKNSLFIWDTHYLCSHSPQEMTESGTRTTYVLVCGFSFHTFLNSPSTAFLFSFSRPFLFWYYFLLQAQHTGLIENGDRKSQCGQVPIIFSASFQ